MRYPRLVLIVMAAMLCIAAVPALAGSDAPFGVQVVRQEGVLVEEEGELFGTGEYWNTRNNFIVELLPPDGWLLQSVQVYAGEEIPPMKRGKPDKRSFPCHRDFSGQVSSMVECSLEDELDHTWGGDQTRFVAVHADVVMLDSEGEVIAENDFWLLPTDEEGALEGFTPWPELRYGGYFTTRFAHPRRGHFIDSPVEGLYFQTGVDPQRPTNWGITADSGAFDYFPGERVQLWISPINSGMGSLNPAYPVYLGESGTDTKISPLDIFSADVNDPRVVNMARLIQSLDADGTPRPRITILPSVAGCLDMARADLGLFQIDFADDAQVDLVIQTTLDYCAGNPEATLVAVSAAEAQGNLEAGLNASGIFRKNVSKTEDWGENKQKLEVMPVYFPGVRSNGNPSLCYDENEDGIYDEGVDQLGVPYEEWRLGGEASGEECDPRLFEDPEACTLTLIECREIAKPLLVNYLEKIDVYDDQVTTDFWPGRFSWDVYTAISRDDGTTWKRMNVSRMADMSSFELETGEPFPGTAGSPYIKVNDHKILVVWESKFCKSGNPRYSINRCDDPTTEEIEADDPLTEESECAVYCTGNPDNGTEVCEPDYPYDDDYYVTDIWGVRGQQGSVNYDEVDDVAELGIGEIPFSCLWAARGVIASAKEIAEGTFASMTILDDNDTPDDTTDDFERAVELGDIVWFKPERITSGRRDVYIPMVGSARGAGFAIAWQEDPKGLRPGKGKGPGEGWSGAISNHKTDIWYTWISYDDFNIVDENFVPGGPGDDPSGDEGYLDKPGLGRPKALVPFSLPVRISDNAMINTNTLKVEPSTDCPEIQTDTSFPDSTGLYDPVCFPEVVDGSFVPVDAEEIAAEFCGHPDADPATCCDPDNHEGDPNCEDLKGFFGNANGTKRYAYMARDIDEVDNVTGLFTGGDGVPDYQYYMDRGGTLDLCDLSDTNTDFYAMPGSSTHERWFGFTNASGRDKLVCVSSDGRLLDGDVFASRPMLQLQPYTKPDGTKSAWALLAYEESKGLGHSLAAAEHEDTESGDEIIGDSGQEKPIKQDIGKNLLYHSFDFSQPDLVHPGHIVNLPALCGGIYPTYCDDPKTPDVIETIEENPTCTCLPGEPVPLYFDYWDDTLDPDGDGPLTGQWIPDDTKFLQFRTEIARRARFLMQSPGKAGATKTLGALIFKQGQEGQGRPADAFIRRFVKSGTGNPYKFENMECTTYLDETFTLPACPNGAGDKPSAVGYNCNVWGEAAGDRLCGGVFTDPTGGYPRRDHINLTSHDVDLAVDAGPVDDTPDDPTDDRYGTNKVLLWSQHEYNLGDESYGYVGAEGQSCDVLGLNGDPQMCPGMYSNVRSHRGFIRGDLLVTAFSLSPNWAAGRNGNDRYNFYVRRSFDGGQTWTTDPAGAGVDLCPEFRSDPNNEDPDGSGNLPPQVLLDAPSGTCGVYDPTTVPDGELPPLPVGLAMTNYLDPMGTSADGVPAQNIGAGVFEPARNVSEIKNNHESSGDPRLGATPPTYPLDGRDPTLPILRFVEDEYLDHMFFVAWGTVDNAKSTGSTGVKAEAGPLDLFYTRTENYGDTFLKVPWVIGGVNSNQGYGETVWRYDFLAKGEPEEQGECQLKATSDGSKAYAIYHSMISAEEDPDEVYTRWYPWKPSESSENDIWFRRVIFWTDELTTP